MPPAPTLPDGEPAAGPWRRVGEADLVRWLVSSAGEPVGRPRVVAVDGRGASGKSTLAGRLTARMPGAAVLHTDDLAWHQPFFGWGSLLRDVLEQVHRGDPVRCVPEAWGEHGRAGAITLPAGLELLVVEGTGASQRLVADLLDARVWVQADFAQAERRGIRRDLDQGVNGDEDATIAFWHEWMAHELRFFADDRPWERADLVVAGTPVIDLAVGEFAVSDGPLLP